MEHATARKRIGEITANFASQRAERQHRRHLDPADFAQLREAGYLLTGVPAEMGGFWVNPAQSTRFACDLLRTLAQGDPSVALVAAMHPAVLSYWMATPHAPEPHRAAWSAQRRQVAESALDGDWWGTITSEPGSGGDVANTRATAEPDGTDGTYRLSGQKHFGSGSGIHRYMMTSAVPSGERELDWFYLDTRGVLDPSGHPKPGVQGVTLLAAWDGHGMAATQSHAFEYREYPAVRVAWQGDWRAVQDAHAGYIPCVFTAVVVGVVDVAVTTARQQIAKRRSGLRAFEQVEWSRVEQEAWLIEQAFEGMLRAMETGNASRRQTLQGKTAVAELAESALARIGRVLGGATFSRHAPFGTWAEDVRALGFLRPPWGLAYDRLLESSLTPPA